MKKIMLSGFVFALLVSSCGASAPQTARTVLDVASAGVVAVDAVSALSYTEHARAALAASATLAEYQILMSPSNALDDALRTTHALLLAADSAIDAWDAGGAEQWLSLAVCVAGALENLRAAIEAAGVELPPALIVALNALAPFVGSCAMQAAPSAPDASVPSSAGGPS